MKGKTPDYKFEQNLRYAPKNRKFKRFPGPPYTATLILNSKSLCYKDLQKTLLLGIFG